MSGIATESSATDAQRVEEVGGGAEDFGGFFSPGSAGAAATQARPSQRTRTDRFAKGTAGDAIGGSAAAGVPQAAPGSANFGLVRKSGAKRVIGAENSRAAVALSGDVVKSYAVSDSLQFNDVEEMQADAISRAYAQEIVEELFVSRWGLDTRDPVVMRKAEDVLFSFLVMRTASPYADYSMFVMIGGKEVQMQDLSDLLAEKEVQRRRFSRAVADDLRKYIEHPDNAKLRNLLITTLAVYPQYVHLAFDGSTKCSGMNRNEIAFVRALESSKLFDDATVQGSLTNASLLDGVFDTGSNVRRRPVA